jgi:hypothetical protein
MGTVTADDGHVHRVRDDTGTLSCSCLWWARYRGGRGPCGHALAAERSDGGPIRGLGELLTVAADCAERSGARGDLAHLAGAAGRRGSSKVGAQARRLRLALTQEAAARQGGRAPRRSPGTLDAVPGSRAAPDQANGPTRTRDAKIHEKNYKQDRTTLNRAVTSRS